MRRRLIAALLAAGLLAVPAAALAQSAGDEQYADPFGELDEPNRQNAGSDGSGTPSDQPAAAAPAAETGVAAGTEAAADSGSTLPRTGFPAVASALLGALLLVMGASVWRRAQPPLALPPWLTAGASRRSRFGARRRRRR